jgi:formylglycine-generating enzyme required for sulfatase activity
MRVLLMSLWMIPLAFGCGEEEQLLVDADKDGVIESKDCDDDDATLGAMSDDEDCDGVLTEDDCDDTDADSPTIPTDADCDGVLTGDDCDDGDPESTTIPTDRDCDGVLTADDCDDGDPGSTTVPTDGDCDGVLTAEDCDDADVEMGNSRYDTDCDGTMNAFVADHGGLMVPIDAQTFTMGCVIGSADCEVGEGPAHAVSLTQGFYLGETEVTQTEYISMMDTNPSASSDCGLDCPVDQVTWHMSAAFANAVSDVEGLERCYSCSGTSNSTNCEVAVQPYDCAGYRLPTEAEWEAAARCGSGDTYAGSSSLDSVGWYLENAEGIPQPVRTRSANLCGLYDMSGSVWEWVGDWYNEDYYSEGDEDEEWFVEDPLGPTVGSSRLMRGGSRNHEASSARVAARSWFSPGNRNGHLGLRLARTSP